MRILIASLFFRKYTGSELYVLHVAKGLKAMGHNVTVTSPYMDYPLIAEAEMAGVQVKAWTELTGREAYNVIHVQHKQVTEHLCVLFPTTPKVATIHSVFYDLERPVKHESIKEYISIAQHEKHEIHARYGVPLNKISVIYNPVDYSRFNTDGVQDGGYVLLAGTVDFMRKAMIYDAAAWCKENDRPFVLVGYDHGDYLKDLIDRFPVHYCDSVSNIETLVKGCHFACGLHIGRTTIEAWMCGKGVMSYHFNAEGAVTKREMLTVPADIANYRTETVCGQLYALYLQAIKG
jgi:glycosyltransferase involved in cell wall biosynthesis